MYISVENRNKEISELLIVDNNCFLRFKKKEAYKLENLLESNITFLYLLERLDLLLGVCKGIDVIIIDIPVKEIKKNKLENEILIKKIDINNFKFKNILVGNFNIEVKFLKYLQFNDLKDIGILIFKKFFKCKINMYNSIKSVLYFFLLNGEIYSLNDIEFGLFMNILSKKYQPYLENIHSHQ
jgi:hypothetical protein